MNIEQTIAQKGPKAAGEILEKMHRELFNKALTETSKIIYGLKNNKSNLTEQGESIQSIGANLHLDLPREDLETANAVPESEIKTFSP